MPKSTIELVKTLLDHFRQFTELCGSGGSGLQGPDVIYSVELTYSKLTFNIARSRDLYFQYTVMHAENRGPVSPECYCEDAQQVKVYAKHFEPLAAASVSIWTNGSDPHQAIHIRDLDKYLTIAESIASPAYLCCAGDDYWPGYFSKINIDTERITLQQVNHMNSRSVAHKNNYSLRELEFEVPLHTPSAAQRTSVGGEEYHIGAMRVCFSDRSSQSNKTCGDKIREKIVEEKQKFISFA